MKQYNLSILSNKKVSERYWHLSVDASSVEKDIVAGQFFNILSKGGDAFLRRPFSIYRYHNDVLEFLYLVKGIGTQEMTSLKAEENLNVIGPLGHGFNLDETATSILLVARGVGIATLAALAYEAHQQGIRCFAILSARSYDDLLAAELLEGYGTRIFKVTEEDGTSDVEHVEQLIHNIIKENDVNRIYTCGSRRLSRLSQKMAGQYGIVGEIALEEHMGCAMGACFACVCELKEPEGSRPARVCIEGPVFELDKVVIG